MLYSPTIFSFFLLPQLQTTIIAQPLVLLLEKPPNIHNPLESVNEKTGRRSTAHHIYHVMPDDAILS
jgi:hypothetical protein